MSAGLQPLPEPFVQALRELGLAGRVLKDTELDQAVTAAMWEPRYLQLEPAPPAEPAR